MTVYFYHLFSSTGLHPFIFWTCVRAKNESLMPAILKLYSSAVYLLLVVYWPILRDHIERDDKG